MFLSANIILPILLKFFNVSIENKIVIPDWKLSKVQRIITRNYDYVNKRGIDIVKNLKWMSVSQRRDYFMSMLMFKSIHGLAPDYKCDEINMQCDIAERSTRSLNFYNAVVP